MLANITLPQTFQPFGPFCTLPDRMLFISQHSVICFLRASFVFFSSSAALREEPILLTAVLFNHGPAEGISSSQSDTLALSSAVS
jgi:hypothetical protein